MPGFAFAGGVQGLAEGATRPAGTDLILSDPAERLSQDAGGVRLRLASGRALSARAAVVALPVNTRIEIRFDPALPPAPALVCVNDHVGRAVKRLIRARDPSDP